MSPPASWSPDPWGAAKQNLNSSKRTKSSTPVGSQKYRKICIKYYCIKYYKVGSCWSLLILWRCLWCELCPTPSSVYRSSTPSRPRNASGRSCPTMRTKLDSMEGLDVPSSRNIPNPRPYRCLRRGSTEQVTKLRLSNQHHSRIPHLQIISFNKQVVPFVHCSARGSGKTSWSKTEWTGYE